MMERHNLRSAVRSTFGAVLIASGLVSSRPLAAQHTSDGFARLVGSPAPIDLRAEARLGAVAPHGARTGIDGTFEWTLGSLGPTSIRPLLGIDAHHADIR